MNGSQNLKLKQKKQGAVLCNYLPFTRNIKCRTHITLIFITHILCTMPTNTAAQNQMLPHIVHNQNIIQNSIQNITQNTNNKYLNTKIGIGQQRRL